MRTQVRVLLIAAIAGGLFAPGVQAGWQYHNVDSMFMASKKNQKHPGSLTVALVVPKDTGDLTRVCTGYVNTAKQKSKGRVVVDIEMTRADQSLAQFRLEGRVKNNVFVDCVFVPSCAAGDLVIFKFRFKKMPKFKAMEDSVDRFTAVGGVLPWSHPSSSLSVEGAAASVVTRWLDAELER